MIMIARIDSLINDNQAMKSRKKATQQCTGMHTISPDKLLSDYMFDYQDFSDKELFIDGFHWILVDMTMIRPFPICSNLK